MAVYSSPKFFFLLRGKIILAPPKKIVGPCCMFKIRLKQLIRNWHVNILANIPLCQINALKTFEEWASLLASCFALPSLSTHNAC